MIVYAVINDNTGMVECFWESEELAKAYTGFLVCHVEQFVVCGQYKLGSFLKDMPKSRDWFDGLIRGLSAVGSREV